MIYSAQSPDMSQFFRVLGSNSSPTMMETTSDKSINYNKDITAQTILDYNGSIEKNIQSKENATPQSITSDNYEDYSIKEETAKEGNLDELIKKLLKKRDLTAKMMHLFSTDSSICDTSESCINDFAEKIKRLDRYIAIVSEAIAESVTPSRGTETSEQTDTKRVEFKLSYEDLPKCHFIGQANSQFSNERWYKNIEEFVNTFEKVIASFNQDVELVWKQYISLSFAEEYKIWVCNNLLTCNSWKAARELLYKRFGNAATRIQARRHIASMKLGISENIINFTTRFNNAMFAAGYEPSDSTVADIFLFSLPHDWQTRVSNYILVQKENVEWTVKEIANAVLQIYGNTTQNQYRENKDDDKRKRKSADHDIQPRKKNKGNFYCGKHGGNKSSHNESDCFSKKPNTNSNHLPRNTFSRNSPTFTYNNSHTS